MLTAFLNVFPGGSAAEGRRGCGKAEVGAGDVGATGNAPEGARSKVLGVLAADFDAAAMAFRLPVLFRVFATGSAGSAMFGGPTFGGPLDGRDGRGSVVAMMDVCATTGCYSEREAWKAVASGGGVNQGHTKAMRLGCSVNADAGVVVHEQSMLNERNAARVFVRASKQGY